MRSYAVLVFVAVSSVQAANPWLGTWDLISVKADVELQMQVTIEPRPGGLAYTSKIASEVTQWTAKFDGNEYAASVPPGASHTRISIRRVNGNTLDCTEKPNGGGAREIRWIVSSDGTELTQTIRFPEVELIRVFDRTGGRFDAAMPFAGVWTSNLSKSLTRRPAYSLEIQADGESGIRLLYSRPATAYGRTWQSVSLKRAADGSYEGNAGNGRTTVTSRASLSADGRQVIIRDAGKGIGGGKVSSEEIFRKR